MITDSPLRLPVQEGTIEGYGLEDNLKVYESSLTQNGVRGARLMTFVLYGGPHGQPQRGIRLTQAQAAELHAYLEEWLGL